MFKYINNVLAPFDCVSKFNTTSSYFKPYLEQIVFSSSDIKQKEEFIRSVPLFYNNLVLAGKLTTYKYLGKSIAKFKTREGDPAGGVTILRENQMYTFLDSVLRHELYWYHSTLYRYKLGVNKDDSLSISFPDVKCLFFFKNSVVHTLRYNLGFDVSVAVGIPNVKANNKDIIRSVFLSSFTILRWRKKR
jgi:hypothetical protein